MPSNGAGGLEVLVRDQDRAEPTVARADDAYFILPTERFASPSDDARTQPDPWPPGGGVAGDRHRRLRAALIGGVVTILAVAAISGAVVARRENSDAAAWRDRAVAEGALDSQLNDTVTKARTSISTLDGRVASMTALVASLNTRITGLQGRLSSVADQKEKALDQDSVLSRLIASAADVSQRLQTCVQDTDAFISALDDAQLGGPGSGTGTALADGAAVDSECAAAETSNDDLQALIAANATS